MKPRTLQAILSELSPVYKPQIQALQTRQSLLPQRLASEEAGLEAKQTEAFDSILGGARRRGLGFSGIPLGEQARYSATEYLPALARLRQGNQDEALSLEEAILGIRERQTNAALGQRQYEQTRYDQWRRDQEAKRAAAAGAFSPSFGGFGGGGGGGATKASPSAKVSVKGADPRAYDQAADRLYGMFGTDLSQVDKNALMSDYLATASSAKRGNVIDLIKLQLYRAERPDLFKHAYSWENSLGTRGALNVTGATSGFLRDRWR